MRLDETDNRELQSKSGIRTTTKRNRWSYDVRNLAWQCAYVRESRGEREGRSRWRIPHKSQNVRTSVVNTRLDTRTDFQNACMLSQLHSFYLLWWCYWKWFWSIVRLRNHKHKTITWLATATPLNGSIHVQNVLAPTSIKGELCRGKLTHFVGAQNPFNPSFV